uniref:Uncharacterized protein n=1 Tax=Ostreococcus sp. 'lucimarinus' TaxID=242159 RepID=A0A7R9XQN2_9CHLO
MLSSLAHGAHIAYRAHAPPSRCENARTRARSVALELNSGRLRRHLPGRRRETSVWARAGRENDDVNERNEQTQNEGDDRAHAVDWREFRARMVAQYSENAALGASIDAASRDGSPPTWAHGLENLDTTRDDGGEEREGCGRKGAGGTGVRDEQGKHRQARGVHPLSLDVLLGNLRGVDFHHDRYATRAVPSLAAEILGYVPLRRERRLEDGADDFAGALAVGEGGDVWVQHVRQHVRADEYEHYEQPDRVSRVCVRHPLHERVRRLLSFHSILVVPLKLEIRIGEACEYESDERIFF